MKALKKHTQSLQDIYDYFEYEEPCMVFPIDDRTEFFWDIGNDSVTFCHKKKNMIWCSKTNEWTCPEHCDDDFYIDEFYYINTVPENQKKKNIYIGKDYTMIVVDTRTDGNSFLAIYNNSKKL